MENRLRTSCDQFSIMLEFMERHGDLSRPADGPQGRQKSDHLWKELTELLNSMGGGISKSTEKWKRVWSDWKTKTKKKAAINNRDLNGTGGGIKKGKPLNPFEERIIKIMGVASVSGEQNVEEAGVEIAENELRLNTDESYEVLIVSQDQATPSATNSSPVAGPSRISNEYRAVTPTIHTQSEHDSQSRTAPDQVELDHDSHSRTTLDRSPRNNPRPVRRQRRYRQGPFDRATTEFVAIETQRLELEKKRLHIEAERVKVDAERVKVDGMLRETLLKLYDKICKDK